MRRSTLIILLFFLVLDSFVFYGAYLKRNVETHPQSLAAPLPEFVWTGFDGINHNVRDLSGHVILVHFWASWCEPCREEFPRLAKLAADNKNIRILALSSDVHKEKAEEFIKMVPVISGLPAPSNLLFGWDPVKAITYDQFATDRYPETIVVDGEGRMRRKYPSPVDWNLPLTRGYLQDLADNKVLP